MYSTVPTPTLKSVFFFQTCRPAVAATATGAFVKFEVTATVKIGKSIEISGTFSFGSTSPATISGVTIFVGDGPGFNSVAGETVRNPLVMTYRPDTANMHRAARATCRACDTIWQGDEAMDELAAELKEGDTPAQTLPNMAELT